MYGGYDTYALFQPVVAEAPVSLYYDNYDSIGYISDEERCAHYYASNRSNNGSIDQDIQNDAVDCTRKKAKSSRNKDEIPVKRDPFSVNSLIPLLVDYDTPMFIRKRNERERQRVRCVNDSYTTLRNCLPFVRKDKRVSKVAILRMAIRYIKQLQKILDENSPNKQIKNDEFNKTNNNNNNTIDEDSS